MSTPAAAHAASTVSPWATLTVLPSMVSSTIRRAGPTGVALIVVGPSSRCRTIGLQLDQRRPHRAGGGLPETADRRIGHHRVEVREEGELPSEVDAGRREPTDGLHLTLRADPARDALSAALVAEEGGDAGQDRRHLDGVVEHHDHP